MGAVFHSPAPAFRRLRRGTVLVGRLENRYRRGRNTFLFDALPEDIPAVLAGVTVGALGKANGVEGNDDLRGAALRAGRNRPIRVWGVDAGHSSSFLGRPPTLPQ